VSKFVVNLNAFQQHSTHVKAPANLFKTPYLRIAQTSTFTSLSFLFSPANYQLPRAKSIPSFSIVKFHSPIRFTHQTFITIKWSLKFPASSPLKFIIDVLIRIEMELRMNNKRLIAIDCCQRGFIFIELFRAFM
jgi:hypothetical protein